MLSVLTAVAFFAQEAGQSGGGGEKTTNPILPSGNEIIWGALSFGILFFLIAKFAFPAVKKGLDARADKIRNSLDEAERTRDEANGILEQYRSQLADAKNESARIIEEARQAADKLRQDLKKQAESEVAELKERAQQDIESQVNRAMSDLQQRVASLSIELAEKVVEHNLDKDTNLQLINRFIDQVGTSS